MTDGPVLDDLFYLPRRGWYKAIHIGEQGLLEGPYDGHGNPTGELHRVHCRIRAIPLSTLQVSDRMLYPRVVDPDRTDADRHVLIVEDEQSGD